MLPTSRASIANKLVGPRLLRVLRLPEVRFGLKAYAWVCFGLAAIIWALREVQTLHYQTAELWAGAVPTAVEFQIFYGELRSDL